MKVSAIQNFTNWRVQKSRDKNSDIFQSTQISFGIANAGKLKILFSYGVPCMYSGIEMIDPSRVQRLMKAGNFKLPVGQLVPLLAQFEHQLNDKENRVFKIIKEESLRFPEYSLKEIFEVLAPVHRKRLRKKQAPIFQQIIEAGHELPDEYRYRFNRLMAETDAKLEGKPIISPFSTVEFKYKLEKIKEDVTKRKENKAIKVLNKMLKEAERLPLKTSSKTEEHQKTVINFLEIIRKKSVLKDYEPLQNLISTSLARLNHEYLTQPFSRKSFIYDLGKLLNDLPQETQDNILSIAEKLPTSKDSTSAYILKCSTEPSEKIAFRLLWSSFASIEHLLPKSKGGEDAMYNFGGATTKENSDRCNIEFTQQLKRKPETKVNCQKYITRIIELARNGIFRKHNIDLAYIKAFKTTIKKQSKGALNLKIDEFERKTLF